MKEKDSVLESKNVVDRRKFLKGTSMAGLGLAGAGLAGSTLFTTAKSVLAATPPIPTASLSASDIAILQFALNLEYLEAEFYTFATTGKSITALGIAVSGLGDSDDHTVGGMQVNFGERDHERNHDENEDAPLTKIAQQIAQDEQEHVQILRTALGSNVIARPKIDLAALGVVSNRTQFLALARAFEDVGVSAYGGAAPLIQSSAILAVAARIALTEGEHTGALRLLVALNDVRTSPVDGQDIVPPPSGTEFFSNQGGLTIVRTTSQVLAILFGSDKPGTHKGGFFPEGVNGSINTV
jgi:hypothetical protein